MGFSFLIAFWLVFLPVSIVHPLAGLVAAMITFALLEAPKGKKKR